MVSNVAVIKNRMTSANAAPLWLIFVAKLHVRVLTLLCTTGGDALDDTCKKSCSIRHGSFFANSKPSLQQWVIMMHINTPAEEAKTSEVSSIPVPERHQ